MRKETYIANGKHFSSFSKILDYARTNSLMFQSVELLPDNVFSYHLVIIDMYSAPFFVIDSHSK